MNLYFKFTLWGAILYAILNICFALDSTAGEVGVIVKPSYTSESYKKEVVVQSSYKIMQSGYFILTNPKFVQRIIWPDTSYKTNVLKNIFLILLSINLLLLLKKNKHGSFVKKDVSIHIQVTGLIFLLMWFVDPIVDYAISTEVSKLTNKQYILEKSSGIMRPEVWMAVMLIWLGSVYKKGVELKQEKDLTI